MHIFANVRAVKSIRLRSFNESRYLIVLEEFFRSGHLMSVAEVNELERVTVGRTVSVSLNIKIGQSIQSLTEQFRSSAEIEHLVLQFEKLNEKFLIVECNKFLGIYLHIDARPQDVLKAYFFAVSYLQDRNQLNDRLWEVQQKWTDFVGMSQREGWYLSTHLLFVEEYRIEWRV